MTNWLEQARRELGVNTESSAQMSKSAGLRADNADENTLLSALSAPQPAKSQNFGVSDVRNGSTPRSSSSEIWPLLSTYEEALLGAWLAQIGETDPRGIEVLMNKCRVDMEAKQYFVKRARGEICLVNSSWETYLREVLLRAEVEVEKRAITCTDQMPRY